MKIQVLDDFLPSFQFNKINSIVSERFQWLWTPSITERGMPDSEERGQFIHMLYDANIGVLSNFFHDLSPIIETLSVMYGKSKSSIILYRIKANLNPKEDNNYQLGNYHVDFDFDCKTCIYYLNTNNGYTKFSDGTVINSVSNRMIVFDSHVEHVGFTCSDQKSRMLINFNFAVPRK